MTERPVLPVRHAPKRPRPDRSPHTRRRQRAKTSSTSGRIARGASTKRRSPGWMTVLPRGGIESRPRSTTATIALRGRPSSRTAEPAMAWSGATTKSIRSSSLRSPTSSGASSRARRGREQVEPAGHPLERPALEDRRDDDDEEDGVEDDVGVGDVGGEREGREHDRHRPAQAGPAEQHALGRGEVAERRGRPHGSRPHDQHEHERQRQARDGHGRQLAAGRRAGRGR